MKTLILIHGRSWKPEREPLEKLWREAIEWGFQRDRPDLLGKLKDEGKTRVRFVYYGDISNKYLSKHKRLARKRVPPDVDLADRKASLAKLKGYMAREFLRSRTYNMLPGALGSKLKEAGADFLSPVLSSMRFGDEMVNMEAPDMGEYWKGSASEYGSLVRQALTPHLSEAMDGNDSICVVGHSLGSIIAYDTFIKFAYMGEYRPQYTDKMVDLFLSIGTPLGDATVQKCLRHWKAEGERKFPPNLRRWVNIAAEDDFICHDKKIADDFRKMKHPYKMVKELRDIVIYNLAMRGGKVNPHNGVGYLIHPKTIRVLASWLD